jgi:hypothetical protein
VARTRAGRAGRAVRGMARAVLILVLGPVPLILADAADAQTYQVEVHEELNGLDVKVDTVESTGMLVVNLTNNSATKVKCDLRYDAAPQPTYRTRTYVDAGKTASSTFRARRKWFTVEVDVRCEQD